MPLFSKKPTEAGKRRLQHKLYVAQESDQAPFDLSECELTEVPAGAFTQIKVLRKESLLLNDNWLRGFGPDSKLRDLGHLRVLDLRNNELSSLPDTIGCLLSLQVLSVDGNRIVRLPAAMQSLSNLQTLTARDNSLKSLTSEIFLGTKSLKHLDISGNPLKQLPQSLCQVRTLESLVLTASSFTFPPKDVCSQGTEAVMRFLCKEAGISYEPPSKFSLNVLPPPSVAAVKEAEKQPLKLLDNVEDSVMAHERAKEQRRLQRLEIEKQRNEDMRNQVELSYRSHEQKRATLARLGQEGSEMQRRRDKADANLTALAAKRDALISLLQQLMSERERRAAELNKRLSEMEQRRRSDQLDYWLLQYQRLLDKRPDELPPLSGGLRRLLRRAGAEQYEPHLQRHRLLDAKSLRLCSDQDLRDVGIRELGIRRAVFRELEAEDAAKEASAPKEASREKLEPSAPPALRPAAAKEAADETLTARFETDCCVCMDRAAELLFLNCGHVCCCTACGSDLAQCPLCRGAVLRRVLLASPGADP